MSALDPAKFPTLLDVSVNDKGSAHDVIVEAIHSHQEVNLFPSSTQPECKLDVQVLVSLPGGDTFRRPNEGVSPSKTTFELKSFDMALVERRVEVDKHGIYERAKDKARLLINQSVPQMAKALSVIAQQIIYGSLNDANKGFPGLLAQANDAATHVVDATGTSAKSSVWLLEVLPANMELVFGADASLTMGDDWDEETVTVDGTNRLKVLSNIIKGWVGFRLLNRNRAVRIKNIGVAAGKLCTNARMNDALNLCQDDLGFTPTHILGHGRSFEQLRKDNITDLLPNPPRLTEFAGIPLIRSINISKDEA